MNDGHTRRARLSLRLKIAPFVAVLILAGVVLPVIAARQDTGVTAEAIGQANLRADTDVSSAQVGEIFAGTRYPVIGQAQGLPWLLLADPTTDEPLGWVFRELLNVQGTLDAVPVSTLVIGAPTAIAPTAPAAESTAAPVSDSDLSPTPTATAQPVTSSVFGLVQGEINLRYGPGVEYERVGIAQAGDRLEIVARHTQISWVQVRADSAPDGLAWVAADLLDIQGDINLLPNITQLQFNLPTLTPTPSAVQGSELSLMGEESVPVSPVFQALGNRLWSMILDAGFEPGTSRPAALFLMDLRTGEAVTVGNDIAFSGMSVTKIAILAALYSLFESPPDNAEAFTIAEAMICSENISSNELLGYIGGGNPFSGAQTVTDFMRNLGLENSFISAPFANDPFITPQPASSVTTNVDQLSAQPDPFNQITVEDIGWLLGSMYQCAYDERGPLLENFTAYSPRECRQMLHIMSNNRINALTEMGVPANTRVAHKHGWTADTHGDAGIVFTPGGDYVLVMAFHNPEWIDYGVTFPLMSEISRTVYNYYNPDEPMTAVREGEVTEECELLGNPVIDDLMSATFDR